MALAEDLPIYKTATALSKVVFAGVRGLPRDVRIILGNKLMDECTQMTTLIMRANSAEQRERHLLEIRERQKQAEAINQLIFETTTSYGIERFARITELLASVGKQVSGWKRQTAASPAARPPRRT